MRRRVVLVFLVVLCSFGSLRAEKPGPRHAQLHSLADLSRHVGEFPCTNGILKDPVFRTALRAVLSRDYGAYLEHLGFSGCGAIAREGAWLVMDVSQLHVGGYNSMIFVRPETREMYVFWLPGYADVGPYRIYGSGPTPPDVATSIVKALNVGWGHVASFEWRDGAVHPGLPKCESLFSQSTRPCR